MHRRQSAVGVSTVRGTGTHRGPGKSQPASLAVERQVRRQSPAATREVVIGHKRIVPLPAELWLCRAGREEA